MSLLRSDLESIQPYTRPASETASIGKARLHMNEAAADWPAAARKALLERLASLPFHRYPERQAELTERLRRRMGVPEGGLMLAIFQVPNKFFEADGRVIDAAGEDWDAAWGHTGRG